MEIWVEGRWYIEFNDMTKSHNILITLMFWVVVGLGIILIYFILTYGGITPHFLWKYNKIFLYLLNKIK